MNGGNAGLGVGLCAALAVCGIASYIMFGRPTNEQPTSGTDRQIPGSSSFPELVDPQSSSVRGVSAGEQESGDIGSSALAKATFGSGCFWCTEAVFQKLAGVRDVASGYSGGSVEDPTYKEVCSGLTGHAEAVQVTYDPAAVSYAKLLEAFWRTHDPTTLNRQGNDVGTQYRSVIFYHDDEQRRLAELYKTQLDEARAFDRPIVTEISPASKFYPAEIDHQDYYEQNQRDPYCQVVIRPKLEKLKKVFGDHLRDDG